MKRANKAHIALIDAEYTIDKSIPCKHDLENIDECGKKLEGSMYPYCEVDDNTGNFRCSQVKITLIITEQD